MYRVIKLQTLKDIAESNGVKNIEIHDRRVKGEGQLSAGGSPFFTPIPRPGLEIAFKTNNGVNTSGRIYESEIDFVMDALNLSPEDPRVQSITYTDKHFFAKLASQGLFEKSFLQIEKMGSEVNSPSEVPTFHPAYSKTTLV